MPDRRRAIRESFAFLGDEYGFVEEEATGTTLYGSVTFKNNTTFVQVLIDRGDVVAFFGPLAEGAVPQSDHFDVYDLAAVRGYPVASAAKDVNAQLAAAGQTLRAVGVDVLGGDFTCLSAVREVVEGRHGKFERERLDRLGDLGDR
jgi:hypothetical protein